MKKRYILGIIVTVIVILFFLSIAIETKDDETVVQNSMMPRLGQKLWIYNMNKHHWREYSEKDSTNSKEEIVLQVQPAEGNGGYTSYKLLTDNVQVPKEDVWFSEGSREFLAGKKLYSYFPKYFEFYEIIFNGVKFVTRKPADDELAYVMKGYEIIRVSELQKGTVKIPYKNGRNSFVLINDTGEDFYKYYIIPNNSEILQLGRFSNQFTVKGKTVVKIQRLEGCLKTYPCYEIDVE